MEHLVPANIFRFKKVENKLTDIQEKLVSNNYVWNNESEREMVRGNFGDIISDADFATKFTRLITGLDANSIDSIIRIIKRQHEYLTNTQAALDVFTETEKQQLKKLHDDFYSVILKVSDNLYVYRNYYLPVNHFEASVFYYKHGVSSVKTINKVAGKTIIDVGGFIGDSALVLSELMPQRIYSFEPVKKNYQNMLKTINLNKRDNIIPINYGLGRATTTMNIYVSTGGGGSSLKKRQGMAYVEETSVKITTLDKFVDKENIGDIALIKVDIEGAEQSFLEGAKQTICKQRPILLISIYHNADDFFGIKPLIENWNLGYSFSIYKPIFEDTTSETLLIAEIIP